MLLLSMQASLGVSAAGPAEQAAQPEPSTAMPRSAAPGSSAAGAVFNLLEFRVEGNTVLKTVEVEQVVYPFLGENKTIKDVEAARQQLEKAYHDRGYLTALVNIPEQRVADGVVTLKVVEAPVGKLRVTGSKYHSLDVIRATVPELAEGNVPNFNRVQQELAGLNRSADRRVTPILRASDTPGRVDVELQVKDEFPLHASAELNNYYSSNTSHLRAIGEVHYDNLFQRGQSVDFQYQTSPDNTKDVRVWSLSYVIPTAGDPVWALYAVHSDSNVSAVGDLNVVGNGDIYGVRLIEPLPKAGDRFYHSLTGGLDYKDFKENVVLQGSDKIATPIHYAPFSVLYSATWLQPAAPDKSTSSAANNANFSNTTFTAGFNFQIRGFASDGEQFHEKRSDASSSYITFKPSLQRQQALPAAWSVVGKIDGQLASGPLISNEQYGIGGIDSVRGYLESERLGDDGMRGSLELHTPNLLARYDARVERAYVLAFAEQGLVRVREPLPTQESGFNLTSCGLGFRFKARGLSIDLDAEHVLNGGFDTKSGANRAQFRVNYGF